MFITRALFITRCDGKGHIWFPISGQEEIEQRYLASRGCNVGTVPSTPSSPRLAVLRKVLRGVLRLSNRLEPTSELMIFSTALTTAVPIDSKRC